MAIVHKSQFKTHGGGNQQGERLTSPRARAHTSSEGQKTRSQHAVAKTTRKHASQHTLKNLDQCEDKDKPPDHQHVRSLMTKTITKGPLSTIPPDVVVSSIQCFAKKHEDYQTDNALTTKILHLIILITVKWFAIRHHSPTIRFVILITWMRLLATTRTKFIH